MWILIPDNVTTFIENIRSKSTVMDKLKFEETLEELKSVEKHSQYHTLVVEIDKIVIPGEGDGLELISLQDYESNTEYYENLVQSRSPELPAYNFDEAKCKVNIYPDGSFEPTFGANCIKMDENFGESRILSILGNAPIGRQGSNTSASSEGSIRARCPRGRGRSGRGREGREDGRGRGLSRTFSAPAESAPAESASVPTSVPSAVPTSSSSAESSSIRPTSVPTSVPPPPPDVIEVRPQVPQLVKIPTVRIKFNPEQINVYFQKWSENSEQTGFNDQQHFLDMDKQIAYSKLFSLYGHPHIRTMPYLYANCHGMFTKDSWIRLYDEFIKGIEPFPEQYKNFCDDSGQILKLEQISSQISVNDDPIAENIMVVIKANKDYIIFSVLINCFVSSNEDNRNIVIVLMRTGIANKDCKADGSEKMSITFQIMGRQEKGFIILNTNYELLESNLYETIQTILGANKLTLIGNISIELIMMHKKAVECVQSYLDNSDSNVCGEILRRIETSVDNLMSVRM
jgi:hypothetical protein